jgi:malate dehydrogenase (quinone)
VPHLDTRIIGSKHSLLFGPYAGFSTRFLKLAPVLQSTAQEPMPGTTFR